MFFPQNNKRCKVILIIRVSRPASAILDGIALVIDLAEKIFINAFHVIEVQKTISSALLLLSLFPAPLTSKLAMELLWPASQKAVTVSPSPVVCVQTEVWSRY